MKVLKNYRPVSHLACISQVSKRIFASRIALDYMNENNLLDSMQSAYTSGHSTKTALLKVHDDIVSAIDKGLGVFVILPLLLTWLIMGSFLHSLNIIFVLTAQFSNSRISQTELSVSLLMVFCLNLVSWRTVFLKDLFLDRLHSPFILLLLRNYNIQYHVYADL